MTEHNMDHLNYIRVVAEADLVYVDKKDRQYEGSWKRRGGVGAFMMLARKWDRLEPFTKKAGYDIFAIIEKEVKHENDMLYSVGQDGTVLAEVRDLRRYLMLVEAEMMARGVVPSGPVFGVAAAGAKKDEPVEVLRAGTYRNTGSDVGFNVRRPFTGVDGKTIYELDPVWVMPDPGELHSTRNKPEAAVVQRFENGEVTVNYATGESQIVSASRLSFRQSAVKELDPVGPVISNGIVYEPGKKSRAATDEDYAKARAAMQPKTIHNADNIACKDAPYVVSANYWQRKNIDKADFDKFWTLRAPDVHVLDPHVVSDSIPRVLRDYYFSRGGEWIINIDRVPVAVRGQFPALRGEVNMKEHEELPAWQRVLYTWDANGTKFRLAQLGWGGGL